MTYERTVRVKHERYCDIPRTEKTKRADGVEYNTFLPIQTQTQIASKITVKIETEILTKRTEIYSAFFSTSDTSNDSIRTRRAKHGGIVCKLRESWRSQKGKLSSINQFTRTVQQYKNLNDCGNGG